MNQLVLTSDIDGHAAYISKRYKELILTEAEGIRGQVIDTARLAIEAYESGEKRLGIIVIKEALRLAEGYIELRAKAIGEEAESCLLVEGLKLIGEMMEDNADAKSIWSVYHEL